MSQTSHIPERLVRQAQAYENLHGRVRAFLTRRRRLSMVNGLRIGFDAVYPAAGPQVDVFCFYVGGDTPRVVTDADLASRPERWRLPIFVRDYAADGAADGAQAKSWAQDHGQPPGTWICWDAETLVDVGYHDNFVAAVTPFLVPTYGSAAYVFGNPPPHFVAAWDGIPGLYNGEARQYASTDTYDLSAFPPDAPLWDTQASPPAPPVQLGEADIMYLATIPQRPGNDFASTGAHCTWIPSPAALADRQRALWAQTGREEAAQVFIMSDAGSLGIPTDKITADKLGVQWPVPGDV